MGERWQTGNMLLQMQRKFRDKCQLLCVEVFCVDEPVIESTWSMAEITRDNNIMRMMVDGNISSDDNIEKGEHIP